MTQHESTFLAACITFSTLPAMAGDLPATDPEPTKGTFVMRVLEKDVGRESFELSADGWHSKGTYDVFGVQKGSFEITEKRAAGSTTISGKANIKGHDTSLEATLTPERFESRVESNPPSTLDLKGKPAPVPYQDIIWAYFIDIGQALAPRVAGGTLKAGDS
ncbi:MAG: hypothetical protein HY292_21120, partial [Planctomycetes bacterium]|nr:hypothetical protein [Planctomycetota bacterium]